MEREHNYRSSLLVIFSHVPSNISCSSIKSKMKNKKKAISGWNLDGLGEMNGLYLANNLDARSWLT